MWDTIPRVTDFSDPALAIWGNLGTVETARATSGIVKLMRGGETDHIVGSTTNMISTNSADGAHDDYSNVVNYLGSTNNIVVGVYSPFDISMDGAVQASGTSRVNDYNMVLAR